MIEAFAGGFFDELAKIAEGGILEEPPEPAPEPEVPDPEAAGAVGDLASSESRRHLTSLLGTTEGRQEVRQNLERLRDQAHRSIQERRALTRGLLRARRDAHGPSPTPRSDLKDLLYGGEPFWTARFAR
jgi:hypothetical protein